MTILRGCRSHFAYGNALTSLGETTFLTDIRAHASQSDCFNYDHAEGQPNFAIEYNCLASDAGDAGTYGTELPGGHKRDNLNGSSHSSFVVRYGGLYEDSLVPTLPTHGATTRRIRFQ